MFDGRICFVKFALHVHFVRVSIGFSHGPKKQHGKPDVASLGRKVTSSTDDVGKKMQASGEFDTSNLLDL